MIKIGYLISYDYNFVFNSIQLIYPFAEEIYLAIDCDRKTWMGNSIDIDESFFEKIKSLDIDKKIKIYEDQFYIAGLEPMHLETRERQMLSTKMGESCWKIQLDADEYCPNFKYLAQFLKKNNFLLKKSAPQINFLPTWISLFKRNEKGFFIISPYEETFSMISNQPKYKFGRNSEGLDLQIDYKVIHQSWARGEQEILTKIQNWGHHYDFETTTFFDRWKNLDETNYKEYEDFHPIYKGFWKKLEFVEAKSIEELILKLSKTYNMKAIPNPSKLKKLHWKSLLGFK